jgi:hypothetical protein
MRGSLSCQRAWTALFGISDQRTYYIPLWQGGFLSQLKSKLHMKLSCFLSHLNQHIRTSVVLIRDLTGARKKRPAKSSMALIICAKELYQSRLPTLHHTLTINNWIDRHREAFRIMMLSQFVSCPELS